MLELLRRLPADPGSPLEVLVFVAVVAALTAGIAALLYLLALSVLWALRGRPAVAFGRLFLPTRVQVRKQVVDSTLAAATALIVVLTLVARHQVVARIEAYPLDQLVASAGGRGAACGHASEQAGLVARLFPAGKVPSPVCEALGRSVQKGASSLLAPVVEAGRSAAARALVEELARRVAEDPRGLARYLTEKSIRGLCVAFLLLYVLWLAFDRLATLRLDPKARAPYAEITRRLLTLGVCLALLLVAVPRLVGDTELLADAVLASLERRPAGAARGPRQDLEARVEEEIRKEHELLQLLQGDGSAEERNVWAAIGQARAEALAGQEALQAALQAQLTGVDARLATVDGRLGALDGRLTAVDSALATADSRLTQLATSLQTTDTALSTARADTTALRDALDSLAARLARELKAVGEEQARLAQLQGGLVAATSALRQHGQESDDRLSRLESRLGRFESALADLRKPTSGWLVVFAAYPGQAFYLDGQRNEAPAVRPVAPGSHSVRDQRTERDFTVHVEAGAVEGVALPVPPVG